MLHSNNLKYVETLSSDGKLVRNIVFSNPQEVRNTLNCLKLLSGHIKDKELLIKVLQALNYKVAVTGDTIDHEQAIHDAEVGISLGGN